MTYTQVLWPGQKHILDNTIPGGPNNSKQILFPEPFIQNYTFHFWIASLSFSNTIFHVKKELFRTKFPLIVGYQIIEWTHNSKKFQNSISKFKILINKVKKVKYANARLFFVKYFLKILITQCYVPTVRNKT